jgi:hypothetical protein
MSLKEKLTNAFTTLCDAFERATRSPLPEHEIQKEMEAEGWKFDTHFANACIPYGAMCRSITFVNAPNGDPAYNNGPTEEQRALFDKTVAQKRVSHGLKP